MMRSSRTWLLLGFVLLLVFLETAHSTEQVTIEFYYWNPKKDPDFCDTCQYWLDAYQQFLGKNDTMNRIQSKYGSQVLVNWTNYYSPNRPTRNARAQLYNLTQPNSIVVNGETRIEGEFNETYINEVIAAYLKGTAPPPPPPPYPPAVYLGLAYMFGFLETFSPCIIALLSFVLSYTIGTTQKFRENMLQVMAFGVGFLSAAILLGLSVGLVFLSMGTFRTALTAGVCTFAILFGLNLLGFNILKFLNIKLETKPLIAKLSRKYALTYVGLLALGFLFYFLDPCIAPIFISTLPLFLLEYLPLILFIFSLGVMTPFVGIGVLAGSISKLARSTYRHKKAIRAASGLMLIAFAIYLIANYVL
jgi:cytochrome c biogenesis protein CcdA